MNGCQLPAASAVLCGLALPAGQTKDAAPVPKYDARTFYETTTYFGASFSADEKRLLLTSDASGVFNAYSLPVEYLVFPDEGHGFGKKENRIQAAEAYRKFLDRYLGSR